MALKEDYLVGQRAERGYFQIGEGRRIVRKCPAATLLNPPQSIDLNNIPLFHSIYNFHLVALHRTYKWLGTV